MQNKKENEMHWKDKLEEAGSFPYAPADKELAWQKLNGRLQEKKSRKKAVWYWSAAACLLPLLLLGIFTYTHQRGVVVKTIPHTSTLKPFIAAKPEPEEAIVTPSAHHSMVKTMQEKKINKNAAQKSITAKADGKENGMPVDSGIMNKIAVVIAPKDSISTIASIVQPQKKKLKVIHINELNEPFESTPVVVHNVYHPRFLPLQIPRESVVPEPLKTIHSTGFISLKSKSSNQ